MALYFRKEVLLNNAPAKFHPCGALNTVFLTYHPVGTKFNRMMERTNERMNRTDEKINDNNQI